MTEIGTLIAGLGVFFAIALANLVIERSLLRDHLKPLLGAFLAGYLFKFGGTTLYQDSLGKESYIAHLQEMWWGTPPIVGMSLMVFGVAWLYLCIMQLKGKFEIDGKNARKHNL